VAACLVGMSSPGGGS